MDIHGAFDVYDVIAIIISNVVFYRLCLFDVYDVIAIIISNVVFYRLCLLFGVSNGR